MDRGLYLGIDLDDENAVISYYQLNMREPETVSTIAGSEVFQIPLLLAKKKGIGQWFIGEEAGRLALEQRNQGAAQLLSKALRHEKVFVENEVYPAEELLALYLKKIILLVGSLGKPIAPERVVISLEKVSKEVTELFAAIAPGMGIRAEQLLLVDRKECFYYFAYCQKEELALHDICLFDYRREQMRCLRLERNQRTKPQVVTLTEEIRQVGETEKDAAFLRILQDCFHGHIVSSVYLVGDGFEGNWMKQSVSFMCKGRRAFIGKNLYSKGACYAAAVRSGEKEWPFVYMGDNEMKVNVSLKVYNQGNPEFFTLINAGDSWYDTVGECEVILTGTPEINFWLQLPNSREAKIEKVMLADLPNRPDRATRLRITAKPLSDVRVQIQMKDLGFGEIFKSSEKVWEYVMKI